MAKVVVGAEVTVGTNQASESVGSLKKQLREAQADVAALSEKFGATSEAAIQAAKKAASLKDAIGDAKALTDAFNPDRKFQSFSSAIQGVVGGFSALQGAQALFGAESEDLQKTLVKVQAAMSLSQGINSIMEAEDSFKILGAVIKTNVVGAFSTLKGAIISTGIGALIVAVGILISQMNDMADAAEEAAKAQEKLNEQTKRFADIGLKANIDALARQEKIDVAKAKLAGKSEEDIFNIQQDYRKRRLELQAGYYNEIKNADKTAATEALNTLKNGIADGQAAQAEFELKQREQRKQANEDAKKKREERLQIEKEGNAAVRKAQQEAFLSGITDEQEKAKELLRLDYENKKIEIEQTKYSATQKAEILKQASIKYWADLAQIEADAKQKQKEENDKWADEALKSMLDNMEAQKKIDEEAYNAKQEQISKIGGLLNNFSEIAGKNTAAGKALAVAGAVIDTYSAANKVLNAKSPAFEVNPYLRFATAGATILTGLLNVKKILAVQVPKGGGGSGSVPGGATSVAAPIAPQIGGTQLNQNQVNQLSSATNRAFVLESDVTGNQERIQRLNRAARIN